MPDDGLEWLTAQAAGLECCSRRSVSTGMSDIQGADRPDRLRANLRILYAASASSESSHKTFGVFRAFVAK
jgi:hypothetical protein